MRGRIQLMRSSLLAVVLLVSVSAQSAPSGKTVYFLKDNVHKQWCGYAREAVFKVQIRARGAMIVGHVVYSDDRPSVVQVTETDETGDWAVNDEYVLESGGKVQTLKRAINILPEDLSEQQIFTITNGRAELLSTTYRELRSGEPTENRAAWFEPPAVITNIRAFSFSALITGKQRAVWTSGEACIPDTER